MSKKIEFFLGANTGAGFYGLYEQFMAQEDTYDLMILKGGPGVGKSSFMGRIARQLEAAGEEVEYIRCSGDPDSLDAVRFAHHATAVVDGTAPHERSKKVHKNFV